MLEERNALEASEITRRSNKIQEILISCREFKSAKTIGAYYAFGSEVRTNLIIETAHSLGKKIALPSVEGDSLTFYELSSEKCLVKGRFGIMEPLPSSPVDNIDLLVVPGVAFDRHGNRLGYGKGYYDKYLAKNKNTISLCAGLAYSFQLLDCLPRREHDVRLDAIATENGIQYT